MGRKLYVGNLPFSASQESLEAKFSECGTVESIKLIIDKETGQSKGFGFVEMGSDAEASAAIEAINGYEIEGRAIKVNEAKPQARNGGSGRGGFSGRGR